MNPTAALPPGILFAQPLTPVANSLFLSFLVAVIPIAVALMIAAVTRIEPSAKLPPSTAGGTAERPSTDVQPGLPRALPETERDRVPAQDGSAKR